jgi:hypothetical protein
MGEVVSESDPVKLDLYFTKGKPDLLSCFLSYIKPHRHETVDVHFQGKRGAEEKSIEGKERGAQVFCTNLKFI